MERPRAGVQDNGGMGYYLILDFKFWIMDRSLLVWKQFEKLISFGDKVRESLNLKESDIEKAIKGVRKTKNKGKEVANNDKSNNHH